jgi:membrane-bound acyltransferase YfiQ involved in biofilm formation
MKGLLGNYAFIISILTAVVIVAVFAFLLDAPRPLVCAMLVLGAFTALLEHILHSRNTSR